MILFRYRMKNWHSRRTDSVCVGTPHCAVFLCLSSLAGSYFCSSSLSLSLSLSLSSDHTLRFWLSCISNLHRVCVTRPFVFRPITTRPFVQLSFGCLPVNLSIVLSIYLAFYQLRCIYANVRKCAGAHSLARSYQLKATTSLLTWLIRTLIIRVWLFISSHSLFHSVACLVNPSVSQVVNQPITHPIG